METQVTFPCNEYGYFDESGTATATGTVTRTFSETCWAKVGSKTIKGIPLSFLPSAPAPVPAPAPEEPEQEPEKEQEPEQPEATEPVPPLATWLLNQKSDSLAYLPSDKIPACTIEEIGEAERYFAGRPERNRGRINWLGDKRRELEATDKERLSLQREIPGWIERRELPRDFSWELLDLPPLEEARTVGRVLGYKNRIEIFRRSYLDGEAERCRETLRANPAWDYQAYGTKNLGATKWRLNEWSLKELREAIDYFQIQDSGLTPGQRVITPLGAGELKCLKPSALQKSCFVLLDKNASTGFRDIFRLDEVKPEPETELTPEQPEQKQPERETGYPTWHIPGQGTAILFPGDLAPRFYPVAATPEPVTATPEPEAEPEPGPEAELEPEPESLQQQLLNRAIAMRNDESPEWRAQWQIDSFGFQWRQHFDSRGWQIDVFPPCRINDSGLADLLGFPESEFKRIRDWFGAKCLPGGRKSNGLLSPRDIAIILHLEGLPHLLESNILWICYLGETTVPDFPMWHHCCQNRGWMFDSSTRNWTAPDYRRFAEDAVTLPIDDLAAKYALAPAKATALADAMGINVGALPPPPQKEDLDPPSPEAPPDELNPESESVALSIAQPWAWAILAGHKDIENRTWPTRRRGRILIHASKKIDPQGMEFLAKMGISPPENLPLGALVGSVTIADCCTNSESLWAIPGQHHFHLKDPILWDDPIPWKGKLGLFPVPDPPTSPPSEPPSEELPEFLQPPKPKPKAPPPPPAGFTQLSLFAAFEQPPPAGGQEPLYQKSPQCTSFSPCHSPPTQSQPSSCGCGSVAGTQAGGGEPNLTSPPPPQTSSAEPPPSGAGSPRPEIVAFSGGTPPQAILAPATIRGSQGRSPPPEPTA